MEKKIFTIMLLPSDPSKVKKYLVSNSFIKTLSIVAGTVLIIAVSLYLDYVRIKKKEIDLVDLTEEVKKQNLQLQTYAEKINGMEEELKRIKKK